MTVYQFAKELAKAASAAREEFFAKYLGHQSNAAMDKLTRLVIIADEQLQVYPEDCLQHTILVGALLAVKRILDAPLKVF